MCPYRHRPARISIVVYLHLGIGIPWDYLESRAFIL